MGKFIDLTGQRFGRLVVIERSENNKYGTTTWLCQCDCGNKKIVSAHNLKQNGVKSCGCLHKDNIDKILKNLIGIKFGKLLVLSMVERPKERKDTFQYYLCKCDCGKEKIVCGSNLRSGNTKSCGCEQIEISKKYLTGKFKTKYMESSFNSLYNTYKNSAKKRNLKFEITKNNFKKLTQQKCFYCGVEPNHINKRSQFNGDYIYNGIDRIDNNIGYIDDNVVPCCFQCNRAKHTSTQQDFLSWVERVYNHSIKGKND